MRRLIVSTFIPLLAMLALVLPVSATVVWCKRDPVVKLNGTLVDIQVDIPVEYVLYEKVKGPIQLEIQIPPSVAGELVINDGFLGYGTEVHFTDGGGAVKGNSFPAKIIASVPIVGDPKDVPMQLTVLPANTLQPVSAQDTTEKTIVELTITGS